MKNLNKEIVDSGNYVVSKERDVKLEAYLGSCVGVTLCDKKAKVGGLIHLLLPKPTGVGKPWKAGVYAETGMPLFLKALYDAGAKKDRLEACVAGGTLVGPVSQMDLDLDIGGKTAEVVLDILKKEGIPVIEAETGGYFGCALSLDLKTLKTSIRPIGDQISSVKKDFKKPTSGDIARAIYDISPIPQITLKILRLLQNGNYSMAEVAGEIKQEQIITAKVLSICNSTFFGLKKKIDSIDRALVILGERLLLKLVVTASLKLYYFDAIKGYSLCKGGLFQHAVGTAIVAEELARFTDRSSPDIAYTAGLLHDIGKIVLDQYISSVYPFFYRRTQIDGVELCDAENEKLGIPHTEAGRLLAEKWSLPKNLTDTIRHHHYPEKATIEPELTHLVYLADLIMSRFQVGQELECLNVDNLSLRLERVGLTPSQFPFLIDLISQRIFNASHVHPDLIPLLPRDRLPRVLKGKWTDARGHRQNQTFLDNKV